MLIKNHLNYRITASKCVERFRNLQAFSLNEVQNNYVYSFNEVSKSSIVLQFDIWNTWVVFLEKRLLELDDCLVNDSVYAAIKHTAREKYRRYVETLQTSDLFPHEFSHVHIKTNGVMFDRFTKNLEKVKNKTAIDAIVFLVKKLEAFLESSLFELQEVDYLVFKSSSDDNSPFISIDQQDLNDANNNKEISTVKRISIYRQMFKLKNVIVKSYIEGPCNLDKVLEPIIEMGVNIEQVKQ